uniref:hypothetical protein n=1 Tax=Nocardia flavorosea TaxID=53429 RepID=UPI002458AD6F
IEIQFTPARVVMQDFTGVPCVVDLATMREAVSALGGDPEKPPGRRGGAPARGGGGRAAAPPPRARAPPPPPPRGPAQPLRYRLPAVGPMRAAR